MLSTSKNNADNHPVSLVRGTSVRYLEKNAQIHEYGER